MIRRLILSAKRYEGDGGIEEITAMKTSKLSLVMLAAGLLTLVPQVATSQPTPKPPIAPLPQPSVALPAQPSRALISARGLAPIGLASPLQTFTDVAGQMVGAGPNVVALVGEDGKSTRQFKTAIAQPVISPLGATGLVIGDVQNKTIATMDLRTGALSPVFKLGEVQDNAPAFPNGRLFTDGKLAAVAADGLNVYVAMEAGFSSAVFKVNVKSKQVVARAWATAADPSAMVFHNGVLFLLVGRGTQVRRFTETLDRSRDNINLPAPAKGLGIRAGEIRGLSSAGNQVLRTVVDPNELTRVAVIKNLDKITLVTAPWRVGKVKPLNLTRRYAVLITGDLAENFWGECFWNDTVWMYKSLLANGYAADDIFVLYGDGADYMSANPAYRHPTPVTNFAATVANVNMVLDGLKNGDAAHGIPKIDSNDTLFVWTFDHGGRTGAGESTLCLRGGSIGADAFSAKLNALEYSSRAVFMQQCFSGGFINPLKSAKTFISTASSATEVAHPADTENETYGGVVYSHGEFNYWVTSAMNRLTPTGAAMNADSNADTFLSSLELHQWNASHESRSETPQSNDMGGVGSTFKFKK